MTSYQSAGVDLEAAEAHVSSIARDVVATWGGNVTGSFGGFAAGVELPPGIARPVIMMSTDGVGTKIELARSLNTWDGIGHDLVAMSVDDLVVSGARPIGFVDYMAVGSLQPERDREIVRSIAHACLAAGCPLLGGETAEHPGVMEPDALDLAGTAVGVLEKGTELGPHRVGIGDKVVGLRSPNLRSNGFSLIRALVTKGSLPSTPDLVEPSVIYAPAVLDAVATGCVHAAAHITGGGLAGNLARSIPPGLGAELASETWEIPAVFRRVAAGGVTTEEMWRTFNMGIGFCLIVGSEEIEAALEATQPHSPKVIGEIVESEGVQIS